MIDEPYFENKAIRLVSKWFVTLAVAIAPIAAATPAVAGVTFYTNSTAYEAALTIASQSVSTFNFNSTPISGYDTSSGLTVDGVNFVGNNGNGGFYLGTAPPYFCCDDYNNPNTTLQGPANNSGYYDISSGYTAITLASGTTAFSFDAYSVEAGNYGGDGADTLNLSVDGSTGVTFTSPNAGTGFLGFISTTPVTSATLTGTGDEEFVDIVDGTVSVISSAVPEPSTWVMMLLGFGMVGFAARSRRQTVRVTYA